MSRVHALLTRDWFPEPLLAGGVLAVVQIRFQFQSAAVNLIRGPVIMMREYGGFILNNKVLYSWWSWCCRGSFGGT